MIVTLVLTAATLLGTAVGSPPSASAQNQPAQNQPAQNVSGWNVLAPSCAQSRGPLVAYGHSYLHSPGIGGSKANYASLAAGALGMQPVIRAVDQATTLDTERLIREGPTRWVPGSAELVVIDSGINDIRARLPTPQWTASLRRSLEAFVPRPVPTILLVRPLQVARIGHPGADPKVIAAYGAAQAEVAARFAAVRIVDASAGWQPRTDLSSDGVHPTPAGEAHLAQALVGAARRSFCRP
jgi:lysophospholipase L1-like esterase